MFHPKLQHFHDIIIPAGCVVVLPGYTLERASCNIFKAALYKVVSFLTDALLHVASNVQSLATLRAFPNQALSTAEQHRGAVVKEAHAFSSCCEVFDRCTSPAEICTHCLLPLQSTAHLLSYSFGCVSKQGVALCRI